LVSWPPKGIDPVSAWGIPFLNCALLLTSGITLTLGHRCTAFGYYERTRKAVYFTLSLGLAFIFLQQKEYYDIPFTIADSVFGSCFFMMTGFHGFHVLVGETFIWVCLERLDNYHFTRQHHVGLECAIWYWHFVDVIWLLLWVAVYLWGG